MKTLNLQNIDIVSTQRAAPANGAPSSGDYNDSMREILADLVSISDLVNQCILPVLNALPDVAKDGLKGSTFYANPDDTGTLFFNKTANRPFTVAEVFQNLFNMQGDLKQAISDLGGKVAKLQTLLATTGQNDALQSVQALSDQIKNVTSLVATLRGSMGGYEARFQQAKAVRLEIPATDPSGIQEMDVSWDVPYKTNDYTVGLSLEDETGGLEIAGWKKLDNGRGVRVTIHNASAAPVAGGILHMIGKSDATGAA